MTSPNSREGIEGTAPWWNNLEEALLRQDKYHFCKVDTTDLKFAIDHYRRFPQELQKAREEERERIIYVTQNIKDAFMSPLTERRWLQCIQFTDQPKPKDQSEIDQPDALTK